jgi:hypothetical protein
MFPLMFTLGTSVVSTLIEGLYGHVRNEYRTGAVPFGAVEMMGYLERVMSYALTGHPKVLCKDGMENIHISLSAIHDGWMSFSSAVQVAEVGNGFLAPFIDESYVPRHEDGSPMFASRNMQATIYGRAHAEVSTRFVKCCFGYFLHTRTYAVRSHARVSAERLSAGQRVTFHERIRTAVLLRDIMNGVQNATDISYGVQNTGAHIRLYSRATSCMVSRTRARIYGCTPARHLVWCPERGRAYTTVLPRDILHGVQNTGAHMRLYSCATSCMVSRTRARIYGCTPARHLVWCPERGRVYTAVLPRDILYGVQNAGAYIRLYVCAILLGG